VNEDIIVRCNCFEGNDIAYPGEKVFVKSRAAVVFIPAIRSLSLFRRAENIAFDSLFENWSISRSKSSDPALLGHGSNYLELNLEERTM
jgi:hypothetical protein